MHKLISAHFFQWRRHWLAKLVLAVLALALLNGWIFRDIYAGRALFPWDFVHTYHAIAFYWQAIVSTGHFPEWIAHQSIGYPACIATPGGLFYPPLWLFVILKIVYSLRIAAAFQCVHVLAGALGVLWLARARRMSWMTSMLAATAYHLFGGFFCNAEHPDIIRGYALLPSLLAALTLGGARAWFRPPARLWAVPFLTLCVTTGSYPGQLTPVLTFAGFYLVAQVFESARRAWLLRAKKAALHLAMLFLGLMLGSPSFGPPLLLMNEIDRAHGRIATDGFAIEHIFSTLFAYDAKWFPGDISMRSFFVTIPILLGLCFVPWSALRRHGALVAMFAGAALLIPGSFMLDLAVKVMPSFGFSRFATADYRGLIAIPAVLFGALGIESLLRRERRFSGLDGLRATAVLFFLEQAAEKYQWRSLPSAKIWDLIGVFVAFVALVAIARVRRLPRIIFPLGMVVLIVADGNRMHRLVTVTWKGPPNNHTYVQEHNALLESLRTPLAARPAREQGGWAYQRRYPPNLRGYINGQWVADDYGPSDHLRVFAHVIADPRISKYILGATEPKLIEPVQGLAAGLAAAQRSSEAIGTVRSTSYAAENVVYDVATSSPAILLENEPSYQGWQAFIQDESHHRRVEVEAAREVWPLRGWRIPAGRYQLHVIYRAPGLRACLAMAGLAIAVWLALAVACAWRRRAWQPLQTPKA